MDVEGVKDLLALLIIEHAEKDTAYEKKAKASEKPELKKKMLSVDDVLSAGAFVAAAMGVRPHEVVRLGVFTVGMVNRLFDEEDEDEIGRAHV